MMLKAKESIGRSNVVQEDNCSIVTGVRVFGTNLKYLGTYLST